MLPLAAIFSLACYREAPRRIPKPWETASVGPVAHTDDARIDPLDPVSTVELAVMSMTGCESTVALVSSDTAARTFVYDACGERLLVHLESMSRETGCVREVTDPPGSGRYTCQDRGGTRADYRPGTAPGSSGGPVHVRGYRRRDGTYVRPHTRRRPR